MVIGRRINEVSDTSGKLTLSVWKATDVLSGAHDFQVDVADDWVCIGGGGTGREHALKGGPDFTVIVIGANYLTASFPSVDAAGEHDWKGWRVKSKDHIHPSPWELIGYAIGIKHKDLNKQELISNLKVFKGVGMAVPHTDFRTYIEMGYSLLGGGFHVVDQPPGGGNIATASFPDSTISWRARSQDMEVPSPSRLDIFAIGIREELKKPHPTGPSLGNTVTSYSSMEFLNLPPSPSGPGSDDPCERCSTITWIRFVWWGRGSSSWRSRRLLVRSRTYNFGKSRHRQQIRIRPHLYSTRLLRLLLQSPPLHTKQTRIPLTLWGSNLYLQKLRLRPRHLLQSVTKGFNSQMRVQVGINRRMTRYVL